MPDNRGVAYIEPDKVEVQSIDFSTFELKDGPGVNPGKRGAPTAPCGDRQVRFDQHLRPEEVEAELGTTHHDSVESLVEACDVVMINCPLHPETESLLDAEIVVRMKRGAYLINTARGKICDRDAVVEALESRQLDAYAGDVWFPQPAPKDRLWRAMPHHGMIPHVSGNTLSEQARETAGTREILECYLDGREIREEYLIVDVGGLAGTGAHSYPPRNATGGSDG